MEAERKASSGCCWPALHAGREQSGQKWYKPGCQGRHSLAAMVAASLHLPGFQVSHLQNKAGEAEDSCLPCGGFSMPRVDTLQTLSEDLLEEGRKE